MLSAAAFGSAVSAPPAPTARTLAPSPGSLGHLQPALSVPAIGRAPAAPRHRVPAHVGQVVFRLAVAGRPPHRPCARRGPPPSASLQPVAQHQAPPGSPAPWRNHREPPEAIDRFPQDLQRPAIAHRHSMAPQDCTGRPGRRGSADAWRTSQLQLGLNFASRWPIEEEIIPIVVILRSPKEAIRGTGHVRPPRIPAQAPRGGAALMASLYGGVAGRTSPRTSMRIICDFDGATTPSGRRRHGAYGTEAGRHAARPLRGGLMVGSMRAALLHLDSALIGQQALATRQGRGWRWAAA